MSDMWAIGNDAIPKDIEVKKENESVVIKARHEGYTRLSDPVRHAREIRFDVEKGILDCIDHLDSKGSHQAERRLHFHPSVEVLGKDVGEGRVLLSCNGRGWVIRWAGDARARIDSGWVSPGYGVRMEAPVLVLTDAVHGKTDLSFRMERLGETLPG